MIHFTFPKIQQKILLIPFSLSPFHYSFSFFLFLFYFFFCICFLILRSYIQVLSFTEQSNLSLKSTAYMEKKKL